MSNNLEARAGVLSHYARLIAERLGNTCYHVNSYESDGIIIGNNLYLDHIFGDDFRSTSVSYKGEVVLFSSNNKKRKQQIYNPGDWEKTLEKLYKKACAAKIKV